MHTVSALLPQDFEHPKFQNALKTIFRKARDAGVGAGIHQVCACVYVCEYVYVCICFEESCRRKGECVCVREFRDTHHGC